MGRAGFVLLLVATVAQAEWKLTPYKCRPLEFEVGVPEGWQAQQDRTGLVASTRDAGFLITREPFLATEKGFAEKWRKQLAAGGVTVDVKLTKARGFVAYRAAWTVEKAKRQIEVWRLFVPGNQMLYNVSFSAEATVDLKGLVDAVLRSFKCAPKALKMKFNRTPDSLGPRISIKIPEGYQKAPMGVRLGGGISRGYTKRLPGYTKPHVAGLIAVGGGYGQSKKQVMQPWDMAKEDFAEVLKKPRVKSAKYGDLKGHSLTAQVLDKKGFPKRFLVFAGKAKQGLIVITVIVDEREARLYKDYLKQVCSQITFAGKK